MSKIELKAYNNSEQHKILYYKDAVDLWILNNQIRYKGATLHKYQTLLDTHILPELGDVELNSITATRINIFLSKKLKSGRIDGQGGLSPSYVRSIMLIINATINFAVQEQWCKPLNSPIYKPGIEKKDLVILTLEEQKRLESALVNTITPTNIGVLLSLNTGLRLGEVCALKWEEIDLEKKIISVRHTVARVKNDKDQASSLIIDSPKTKTSKRDIPISSKLLPILKKYKECSTSKYVTSEKEGFISPRTFDYRYHQLLKKEGIPSVNFHVLRHTFATRCIEAGVDIKSLSEILGHANVDITLNTYVHSSMEMKRKQLEKLNFL